MRNMNKQNKKGFTLVELVVVIAILGILAGIAIPRFMEANKAARGAKIVADMRTIESAVNIYYVTHGSYPADKDAPGFANIVNGGTWPTPPIGNFTISHTMGSTGDDPTSGTCTENTAYTYTIRDEDSLGDTVTLTDTTNLSNCADTTSPTVIELLTNNSTTSEYTASISSLFSTYNELTNGSGIGITYLNTFLNSGADRSVSEDFLETYGINTESNEDLEWYADYNGNNNGTVLFLTTSEQFNSRNWTALAVITEDGTVYTSNSSYTANGSTYTNFSSIRAAVAGDGNPNNNGSGTDIISTEIGNRLTSNGNFTKETTPLEF